MNEPTHLPILEVFYLLIDMDGEMVTCINKVLETFGPNASLYHEKYTQPVNGQ